MLLALGGGFLLSVGVSWYAAVWQQYVIFPHDGPPQGSLDWLFDVPEDWPKLTDGPPGCIGRSAWTEQVVQGGISDDSSTEYMIVQVSYGWPIKSLCHRTAYTYPKMPDSPPGMHFDYHIPFTAVDLGTFAHGIEIPDLTPTGHNTRLPLIPRPLGFGINFLLYSVACFVVLFAFSLALGRLRDWHRSTRGLCRSCGYELANLKTCPECGTAAKPRTMPQ
jgi:hypothetical protein